jgi:hypothetical protein
MSRRYDFLALFAVVTMCWVAASLPRLGMADSWSGASWSAGWPVPCERWHVAADGVEDKRSFSTRAVALDVAWWLYALLIVWVVIRLWVPCPAGHQSSVVPKNYTGDKGNPPAVPDPAR